MVVREKLDDVTPSKWTVWKEEVESNQRSGSRFRGSRNNEKGSSGKKEREESMAS